jgi:type II secretory pathway component GspD/PulD (secretin)
MVVMELRQKADQIGEFVEIDGNQVPTILNREFTASIAVQDGETVVLGGLINTDFKETVNKIPILGDIPLIGRYLFSSVKKVEVQRELVVLMTPYVVTNHEEMRRQTERLYKGTELTKEDWGGHNWSESPLRLIPDPVEEFEEKGVELSPDPPTVKP